MGPEQVEFIVLSLMAEAIVVAFHRHTWFGLDYCLTPSRRLSPIWHDRLCRIQRRGPSRLPQAEVGRPTWRKFKAHPIGYFHIDTAEVQTAEGRLYLHVA